MSENGRVTKRVVTNLGELIPGDRFGFHYPDREIEKGYLDCVKLSSECRIGRGMKQLLGQPNIQLYFNGDYNLRYHGPTLKVVVEREVCSCGTVLIRSFDKLGSYFVCASCTPRMVSQKVDREPIMSAEASFSVDEKE